MIDDKVYSELVDVLEQLLSVINSLLSQENSYKLKQNKSEAESWLEYLQNNNSIASLKALEDEISDRLFYAFDFSFSNSALDKERVDLMKLFLKKSFEYRTVYKQSNGYICDCCERTSIDISSDKQLQTVKEFFELNIQKGTFVNVTQKKPYYEFIGKDGVSYKNFADYWYVCNSCGCLWEFKLPDFPANGFVKKHFEGIDKYKGKLCIEMEESFN